MRIYRPVLHQEVQDFGVNLPCVRAGTLTIVADSKNGVCPPGTTSYYNAIGLKGHNGKDYACPIGTPVYLPVEDDGGTTYTCLTSYNEKSGNMLIAVSNNPIALPHPPKEQGAFRQADKEYQKLNGKLHIGFRFAHLASMIPNGSIIKGGDLIGYTGATGNVSGPHLHFGLAVHQSGGIGFSVDSDNGYNSCFDFREYYIDAYWGDKDQYSKLKALVATLISLVSALLSKRRA